MQPISTERLILRSFNIDDARALWKILGTPQAACFSDEVLATHAAAAAECIKRGNEPPGSQVAVCLQEHPLIMIGYLFGMEENQSTWSVGWNFNKIFCGKGYAFEAARAYLDFLFQVKKGRRIYAYTASDNTRSQNLCKKLGMRLEGLLKEHISFVNDAAGKPVFEDTCIYAILAKEWQYMNPGKEADRARDSANQARC